MQISPNSLFVRQDTSFEPSPSSAAKDPKQSPPPQQTSDNSTGEISFSGYAPNTTLNTRHHGPGTPSDYMYFLEKLQHTQLALPWRPFSEFEPDQLPSQCDEAKANE